jgi:cell division protein ZapB
MGQNQLKALEKKIDELISLCTNLNRENQTLKLDSQGWDKERLGLIASNDLARTKVEAMINRLHALEQES